MKMLVNLQYLSQIDKTCHYNIGFKTTGLGQGANSALPMFAKFYQKLNADSKFNNITAIFIPMKLHVDPQ